MKLRNKKTGEIIETGRSFLRMPDSRKSEYDSLEELILEWEDYEEPKEYWFINSLGEAIRPSDTTDWAPEDDSYHKEIGNYFETPEEAEKAVEKLKAWKRLSSLSFKFKGWRTANLGADKYYFIITAESDGAGKGDLDLLFGGEE